MRTPKTFEQQIHRIHELLEDSKVDVTWNDHVPDPDNPSQQRQIDITLKRDGKLTLVECRLHRARQGVKWIEELIGRRISLGANSVIAVSASGFTKGALKKAKRFGIILRDLRALTDVEVLNWGRSVALTLIFYQYSDLELSLLFDSTSIPKLAENRLKEELKSHPGFQLLFNAAAEQLDTLNLLRDERVGHTASFRIRLQLENFLLCSEPVVEVEFAGKAQVIAQNMVCPVVVAYGSPERGVEQRDVVVEQFALGESSVIHDASRITIHIDISTLYMPPFCQFRFVNVSGKEEMDHEAFELVGVEKLRVPGGRMKINITSTLSTSVMPHD